MQQEIFGPLLPMMTYRTLEDALRIIAAREKPLVLYTPALLLSLLTVAVRAAVCPAVTVVGVDELRAKNSRWISDCCRRHRTLLLRRRLP